MKTDILAPTIRFSWDTVLFFFFKSRTMLKFFKCGSWFCRTLPRSPMSSQHFNPLLLLSQYCSDCPISGQWECPTFTTRGLYKGPCPLPCCLVKSLTHWGPCGATVLTTDCPSVSIAPHSWDSALFSFWTILNKLILWFIQFANASNDCDEFLGFGGAL